MLCCTITSPVHSLEETAISHILNAEGEKLQKAISISRDKKDLIEINAAFFFQVRCPLQPPSWQFTSPSEEVSFLPLPMLQMILSLFYYGLWLQPKILLIYLSSYAF